MARPCLDDVGEHSRDHREFAAEFAGACGRNTCIERDDIGLHRDVAKPLGDIDLPFVRGGLDAAHLVLIRKRDLLQQFEQRSGLGHQRIDLGLLIVTARFDARHGAFGERDELLDALVGPAAAEIDLTQRSGKHAWQALVTVHQFGMRLCEGGEACLQHSECRTVAERRKQRMQHDALREHALPARQVDKLADDRSGDGVGA
jgi:hypothetical protein